MLFGDNLEMIQEICTIVMSDFPELSKKLSSAIQGKDQELISQYAHTLKGSIANVGGDRASQIAHEIHIAAKDKDYVTCSRLYPLLEEELQEFFAALKSYAHLEDV